VANHSLDTETVVIPPGNAITYITTDIIGGAVNKSYQASDAITGTPYAAFWDIQKKSWADGSKFLLVADLWNTLEEWTITSPFTTWTKTRNADGSVPESVLTRYVKSFGWYNGGVLTTIIDGLINTVSASDFRLEGSSFSEAPNAGSYIIHVHQWSNTSYECIATQPDAGFIEYRRNRKTSGWDSGWTLTRNADGSVPNATNAQKVMSYGHYTAADNLGYIVASLAVANTNIIITGDSMTGGVPSAGLYIYYISYWDTGSWQVRAESNNSGDRTQYVIGYYAGWGSWIKTRNSDGSVPNATNATNATHATSADSATNATHATSADSATNATHLLNPIYLEGNHTVGEIYNALSSLVTASNPSVAVNLEMAYTSGSNIFKRITYVNASTLHGHGLIHYISGSTFTYSDLELDFVASNDNSFFVLLTA
jgi:hypothetical protein